MTNHYAIHILRDAILKIGGYGLCGECGQDLDAIAGLRSMLDTANAERDAAEAEAARIHDLAGKEVAELRAEICRLREGVAAASADLVSATYEAGPEHIKKFVHYALRKLGDAFNPPKRKANRREASG